MAFASHQSSFDNLDRTKIVEMLRSCTVNVDPDVTIAITGEKPLQVHRQVLTQKSSYFSENIGKGMPDAVEILEFPEISPKILKLVIQWMYSDSIVLTRIDTIDIYKAAKFFGIFELQVMCQQFISTNVDCALEFLLRSFEENSEFTREEGVRLVSPLFLNVVAHKKFPALEVEYLVALLASDELNVNLENEVFVAALRWLLTDWVSRKEFCSDIMSHIRFHLLEGDTLEAILAKCDQFFFGGETPDFKIAAENIYSKIGQNEKSLNSAKGPRKRGTYYKERSRSYEVDYTVSPTMSETIIQSHGACSGEITANINLHNRPSFIDTRGVGNCSVSGSDTVHLWLRRLDVPPEMAHLVKMEAFVGLAHSVIDDEITDIQPKAVEFAVAKSYHMSLHEQESGESAQAVNVIADSTVMVDVVMDAELHEDGSLEEAGFKKLPRFTKVPPTSVNYVAAKSRENQKGTVKREEGNIERKDLIMENCILCTSEEVKHQEEITISPSEDVTCNLIKSKEETRVTCPSYDTFDVYNEQKDYKTMTSVFTDDTLDEISSLSINDFETSLEIVDLETPRIAENLDTSELSEFSNGMFTPDEELPSTPRRLNSPEGDQYMDCDNIVNVSSIIFGDDRQVLTEISFTSEGDVVTTTSTNMKAMGNDGQSCDHQTAASVKKETVSRKIDTSQSTNSSFLLLYIDIKCPNLVESEDQILKLEVRISPSLFEKKKDDCKEETKGMSVVVKSEGDRKKVVHIGEAPKDDVKVNVKCPIPLQSNLVGGEAFWKGSAASVPMAAEPKKDKVTEWLNTNTVEDDFKVQKTDKDLKSASSADTKEGEFATGTLNRESTLKKHSKIPRIVGPSRSNVRSEDLPNASGSCVKSQMKKESKISSQTVPMDTRKAHTNYSSCNQANVPRHVKCMQTTSKLNSATPPRQKLAVKPKPNTDRRWKY